MTIQINRLKHYTRPSLILLLSVWTTMQSMHAGAAEENIIEEIVVTAERRSQSLQEVSSSISVVTAKAIEELGIRNTQDLQNYVPGLTIRSSQIGNNSFTIRGVGDSNEDVSTDSGVGVYVDDIFMARTSASNLSLYDLERVEVLRGPQGTLYGRNTAGGSINIITSKPSEEFTAKVAVDAGDKGRLNGRAFISGPITDKLFAKASFATLNRDGIMKNLFDGTHGNNIDTVTGRVGLRYVPNETTEFLLTFDKEDTDQKGGFKSVGPDDGYTWVNGFLDDPLPAADPERSANLNNPGSETFETSGVMARVNFDFEPATVSLIYGFREEETFYDEDLDRDPTDGLNEIHDEDGEWSSVELRISSAGDGSWSAGGALDWTAGLYYFTEDTNQTLEFNGTSAGGILCNFVMVDGPPTLFGGTTQCNGAFASDGIAWQPGEVVPFDSFGDVIYFQRIETEAFAAYVHGALSFNENMTVKAGLRYTNEEKTFTARTSTGGLVPALPSHPLIQEDIDCKGDKSFDNVLGKFSVEYNFDDSKMAYALFSQGYRSGGFNGQANTNFEACGGFDEEVADNFELGLKADWFDRRLRTNISVFKMDYKDLQVSVRRLDGTPTTTNAADAEIEGAEFEFWLNPVANLSLNANVAVLDAVFSDFITEENGQIVDKSGESIASVPELTFNIGVEYDLPLDNGALVSLRGDYVYEGKTEFVDSNLPEWETVNFRATYEAPEGNWSIAAWVRNAFDETYWTSVGPNDSADVPSPRVLAEPRTVGITLQYQFGG